MQKEQLIQKLDLAWADLQGAIAGLTEAEMLEPGVTGNWSVKDILAHVTWWEAESLQHLPAILRGERTPRYADLYGGINAFNAQMSEKKRGLTLTQVLDEMNETHRRLIETVRAAPDEQIATETRFRRRLRLDTYSHYPEHTRAIRAWRASRA